MEVVCLNLGPVLTSCDSTILTFFACFLGFDIPTSYFIFTEKGFMAHRAIPIIAFHGVEYIYVFFEKPVTLDK